MASPSSRSLSNTSGRTYSTTGRFSRDGRRYWPIVTMSTRASRRRSRRSATSSGRSPSPSMKPDFVVMRRVEILHRRQQRQRAIQARAPAHVAVQPRHRFDVVVEDVGLRRHDRFDRRAPAAKIGRQDFDTGRRLERADRADRFGEMGGAPVGEIVAVHRRQDDELEGHPLHGRAHPDGLQRVDRERLAVRDVAEAAGPRADVAEQEEGRRAAGETLAAVGAARLFADRVQPVRPHHGLDLVQIGEAKLALANPLGSAHRQRRAHIPSGTTQGDLTFSWRASFVAALSASSSER